MTAPGIADTGEIEERLDGPILPRPTMQRHPDHLGGTCLGEDRERIGTRIGRRHLVPARPQCLGDASPARKRDLPLR